MMKLHYLQALRALAAWLVVADHALLEVTQHDPANPVTPIAWALGTIGVYLFFVISGFIMVHISWDNFGERGIVAGFLRRRFVRIVPFYWLATLGAFLFHRIAATHGADAGWPEVVRSLLFIPYLDETGHWAPLLPQGWSLSYETMFYAFFAVALAFPRRFALPALAAGLGLLCLAEPLLPPGALAHLASPIVLWFVLGTAIGAFFRWRRLGEPQWLARACRLFEPCGDASYSTYLVHGVALTVLLRAWMHFAGVPTVWFVPAGMVFATAAGLLVHAGVERPVLRGANRLWSLAGAAAALRSRPAPTGTALPAVGQD